MAARQRKADVCGHALRDKGPQGRKEYQKRGLCPKCFSVAYAQVIDPENPTTWEWLESQKLAAPKNRPRPTSEMGRKIAAAKSKRG
jgi:hypothetical protein